MLLVGACDKSTTEPEVVWIRFEPTALVYAGGDQVTLTLSSLVSDTIRLAPCSALERLDNGVWVEAGPPVSCADIEVALNPLSSRLMLGGTIPLDARQGTYRYRLRSARVNGIELPSDAVVSTPLHVNP